MIKSHPQWENILDSYFKSNGFVKQQIESYNEFVEHDIQKIIDETGPIEIRTDPSSRGGEMVYTITFGQISLKKPVIREHDGTTTVLYPQEARNRSLTYHSALYCDISVKARKVSTDEETINTSREQLGFLPIMVHSKFCLLNQKKTEKQLADLNECIYDEGGYFIVSGNEKVVVAQERMPFNEVFCFYKKPPSKIIWQAEIRSQFEYHIKSTSTMYVKLFSKGARTQNNTPTFTDIDGIRVQITYIKQDIPIVFMFYALGYTNDDIINIIENSSIVKDKEYKKNIIKFMRCSFDEAEKIMNDEEVDLNIERVEESDTEEETKIETYEEPTSQIDKKNLQEFALEYIGKKGSTVFSSKEDRIKYAIGIINKELLPHLHTDYTSVYLDTLQLKKLKAHYIAYIINKLFLCYTKKINENDRDHLANKRMELTGNLMANLFRTIFKRVHKEAKVILTKSIESNNTFDLVNAIKSKSITNDIKYALSTGNWGRQTSGTAPKMGVAQQLSRLTYSSTLSHLRRLNTPLNREGKQAKPRQLHGTHYGLLCPAETPEGQGCGLLKNMAIMCHISIGSKVSSDLLIEYLKKNESAYFIENKDLSEEGLYKVFIDGAWIVSVRLDSIEKLNRTFIYFRRKLIVHYDTSICLDHERKEMNIYTGSGRCSRPLLVVENMHRLDPPRNLSWTELLTEGIVEYIDVSEEEETTIAMDLNTLNKDPKKYTHMEIHPSVMLGICASIIPFSDHNQSPRNIYQSSMGKQAMGLYCSNFNKRFDTLAHVLHSPQRPLVSTKAMKYIKFNELPAGINVIVAIASYGGYNQEDSIIVNQSAIDRGLFRSSFFRTYVDQEKEIVRVGGLMEQFEIPNKNETKGIQHGNYGKLAQDGIVEPGSRLVENDVIIGKTTPIAASKQEINQLKKFKKRDVSTSMRPNEVGVVESVMLTTNSEGYKYTKVKVRSVRVPEIGDKLACYSSDHDVLTADGWVPVAEVTKEHKVATLVNGKKLKYEHPTEIMNYDYKGPMYTVETNQVSLKVTPNHRMYVGNKSMKYDIEKAEDIIGKTRYYSKACEMYEVDHVPRELEEPGKFRIYNGDELEIDIPLRPWLTLFGIWIAEGNDFLIEALDKKLASYLNDLADKNLPEWVWYLDKEHCKILINAMTLVHAKENGTKRYDTSSIKLADSFQRLCLHAGYSTDIKYEAGHKEWRLTVIEKQNNPAVNKSIKNQDSYVEFEGKVYCCTVPSGVIYVRRNGMPVWCGQSRHGQKGTIGMTYRQEDMPFTKEGIVPDIIINPHAIPSRMTIGHLIEAVLSKLCALEGKIGDATPFNGVSAEQIAEGLESHGYAGDGTEVLYNGETGEPMPARIFICPTYYQRLKHMVFDKIHGRASGPVTKLTRQPLEGRSREGGLRFGEMERDGLVSHGATNMLKDRLFYNSDPYRIHVCKLCGMICQADLDKQQFLCKCVKGGNTTEIAQVFIPYACKLFFQELMAMSIAPRIKL